MTDGLTTHCRRADPEELVPADGKYALVYEQKQVIKDFLRL